MAVEVVADLSFLAAALLGVACASLTGTWALAVRARQTRGSYFPLVCNAGSKPPASRVFTYGLNTSAALCAVVVTIAHLKQDAEAVALGASGGTRVLGAVAAATGICTALSLALMGTYSFLEAPRGHNAAAGAFQTFSVAYQGLGAAFSGSYGASAEVVTQRYVAVVWAVLAALGMLPCIVLEARRQKTKARERARARAERRRKLQALGVSVGSGVIAVPSPDAGDGADTKDTTPSANGHGGEATSRDDFQAVSMPGNGTPARAKVGSRKVIPEHRSDGADTAVGSGSDDAEVEVAAERAAIEAARQGKLEKVSTADLLRFSTVGQRRALAGSDSARHVTPEGTLRGVPRHLEVWAALQYATFAGMLFYLSTFIHDLESLSITMQV